MRTWGRKRFLRALNKTDPSIFVHVYPTRWICEINGFRSLQLLHCFFLNRMMHHPTLPASFFWSPSSILWRENKTKKWKIRHFSVKRSYINKNKKTEALTLKDGSDTERESGTNGWIRATEEGVEQRGVWMRGAEKRDCKKMNLGQWNLITQVLIRHVQCKRCRFLGSTSTYQSQLQRDLIIARVLSLKGIFIKAKQGFGIYTRAKMQLWCPREIISAVNTDLSRCSHDLFLMLMTGSGWLQEGF